jgi:WD repeat-containing protein 59
VTHRPSPVRQSQNDVYPTIRSWKDGRGQSPTWVHPASSPVANFPSISLSSMSSRGSWSSLFNTSNVRQLIGSSFDPAREGGHTEPTAQEGDPAGIPVPGNRSRKFSDLDSPRRGVSKPDSPQRLSPTPRVDIGVARSLGSVPPIGAQLRRPTFSQIAKARHGTSQKSVVFVDLLQQGP